MNKILVLIGMLAMISVSSFANQSCPVRDSPNGSTAFLHQSDVKATGYCIEIPVELTKPSQGETTLLIEVRDSQGNFVGTADVTIADGRKMNHTGRSYSMYCNDDKIKSGQWYSLSIARATCIEPW